MRFNYTSILLVLLAISVIYSVSVLVLEEQYNGESQVLNTRHSEKYKNNVKGSSTWYFEDTGKQDLATPSNIDETHGAQSEGAGLPKFSLVGLYIDAVEARSLALISFKGELYEYSIGDFMLDMNMQLNAIQDNAIKVELNEQVYSIELTKPNLLKDGVANDFKTMEELLEMTPKEIGSRPRIIEHLAILIPTPFIADGVLVKPGLNPDLFAQAGFKEDDVLKTINGKSVTVETEFALIKEELKVAQTLEFTVMRKGRMITLYLDIPSEALTIK